MNVFISYSQKDKDVAREISNALSSTNFNVFIDEMIPIGSDVYKEIGRNLLKADAVIALISENTSNSMWMSYETTSFLTNKKENAIFLPIVIGEVVDLPIYLRKYLYLKMSAVEGINNIIGNLIVRLKLHEQSIIKINEEKKITEEKVKTSLSLYIKDVFNNLKSSEKNNRILSYIFYALSILTIIISIIAFVLINTKSNKILGNNDYVQYIFYLSSNVFFIALIVALSRMFFVLGKSFMVEAIRNADRIHAISFGKFFLDAYGKEASREEIISAFSSWNIDGGSSFRTQSTEEFDPKVYEYMKLIGKKLG